MFAAAIATDGPAATATSLAATLDGYRLAFLVAAGVFALALAVVIAFVRPSTSEASEPTTAAGG